MQLPGRDWRGATPWIAGIAILLGLAVAIPYLLQPGGTSVSLDTFRSMGRDELIRAAAHALSSDGFRVENFDRITVDDAEGEDLCVRFDMSVRYVPADSEAYYEALHCLAQQLSVRTALRNPRERTPAGEVAFFEPSDVSRNAIAFVMEALARDPEAGIDPTGKPPEGTTVNILDGEGAYDVEVVSRTLEVQFSVEKGTGRVTELAHSELVPEPPSDDPEPEG